MSVIESLETESLLRLGATAEDVAALRAGLLQAESIADPVARWVLLSHQVLRPSFPGAVHLAVFRANYRDWPDRAGPPPAWIPGPEVRSMTNLGRLLDDLGFPDQEAFHEWSTRNRARFWGMMAERIGVVFERRGELVLDETRGVESPLWYPGSLLALSRSCFQADASAVAVVEHSESGTRWTLTYGELDRLSNRVAGALGHLGLKPGDAVGMFLPMTVEAVAALLGIQKAGCVAVGIAESFAPAEVALRLEIARSRLVITQDFAHRRGQRIPIYQKFTSLDGVRAVVVGQDGPASGLRPEDLTWEQFLDPSDRFDPVPRAPGDEAIILFSSGTTGEPKAIPWTQTTAIKAATDGYLYHDIQPGDVVAWPSSPGWMMGPWLVYATLMNRGTIALYDGHPGTEGFCRFVDEARVTILGLVPSLVSAWKAGGWPALCDWSRIKLFSSTGECSNAADMLELMSWAGYRPVIEYCGGTEIGGGYITSTTLRPSAPACFNTVAFGVDLEIRDEAGEPSEIGEGYLEGPSIGLSTSLLNRDHHEVYFEGTPNSAGGVPLRRHGDRIERLPGGYYRVLGRVDDTMNLGGIKVSSVEIERVLVRHPEVRECAAVAVADAGGGPERLVVYVVAEGSIADQPRLRRELQDALSGRLNPLFRISEVVLVDALPRTASNKVMRRLLRAESSPPRES